MRTLSRRELNRAVLARQLLLERARTPLPRALERVAGIQGQYAPSMYVGLWSRLEGFERATLTAALERRSVVQATLMRHTIHLVSRADYWPLALAVRDTRRAHWLRAVPDAPSPRAMAGAARRLRAALDGTITRKGDRGAGRQAGRRRRRALDRPRPRAAVRHLGAPPGGPVRGGRGLGRRAALRRGPRRAPRPPLPGRLRAGRAQGRRELHRPPAGPGPRPPGPARAAPLPRRGRRGPARRAARSAARSRHAGAAPLPAHLGRDAARPRPPQRRPARGAPREDLLQPQPALVPDLPGRRPGGRHLAPRQGQDPARPVRPARRRGARELEREADRLAEFYA